MTQVIDPHERLQWNVVMYLVTKLYMFLFYCLYLMRVIKIHMWKKFTVRWNLALYDEED